MKAIAVGLCATAALLAAGMHRAAAEDITVKMRAIDANGVGKEIGTVRAVDTSKGLMLVPRLSGLAPGAHGIHVHANPSCSAKGADGTMGAGLGAGGHFDPDKTGKHEGPMGQGHKGDLPVLAVDDKGMARKAMTAAPHLKVADLWGHAIIIHAGGDNYSDQPAALGGGGARIACGTIVKAQAKTR